MPKLVTRSAWIAPTLAAAMILPTTCKPVATRAGAAILHAAKATPAHSAGSAVSSPLGPIFDAANLGGPVVLDKGWRVGVTADPQAAQPGFDDSKWAVRDAGQSMEDVPGPEDEGPSSAGGNAAGSGEHGGAHVQVGLPVDARHRFVWFRQHIRLAPNHGPVALLLELPVSVNATFGPGSTGDLIRVFANGQRIVPGGPHSTDTEDYLEIPRMFDLNIPPGETGLTLAIRTPYIPFGNGAYTSFFADRTLWLGNPSDLEHYLSLWGNRNLFERLPRLVYSVLLVVLALFLLALYFAQKGQNEYLWLALHYLVQAPIGFVELGGSSGHLHSLTYAALVMQLMLASAYLFFEFLISFLTLRRRWYTQTLRYTAPILAGVGPLMLLVSRNDTLIGIALALVLLGCLFWMLGWLIFMFATLIAATVRRNFEAGLLLIPLVLNLVGSVEPAVTTGMSNFMGKPNQSPLTFMAGPIPVHLANIADFTGVLAIVIIIFGRFLRIQREQQHATSELAAARSVQELMIPHEKVATPGFEVISVYNPANEVGGDFFHVQTPGGGGVLVVIGDVAGKGLKAAMTVSMIMGALRRAAETSPARILEALNRVLAGSESFTTCQAAWFAADGELLLANAGHLPPYLNSQEISVPGGLPLGVIGDLKYEEMRLYLHPGDRILFLSDGVVEARRPSGELFGFERVHTLAGQPAGYIADAARVFGQEDDITVLTVRRLAHPEGSREADQSRHSEPATLTAAAAGESNG